VNPSPFFADERGLSDWKGAPFAKGGVSLYVEAPKQVAALHHMISALPDYL
tara:strand:+ start:2483 stop:2635 length:153 start_codon:yes stop_codon:yes gene_type:complete